VVLTVSVDVPEVVMEVGLKLTVAPVGIPLAVRFTTPVKPPDGVTLTVSLTFEPATAVKLAGAVDMVKLGFPSVAVKLVKPNAE